MTTETTKTLPKVDPLPGVVCPQFVRCGTPGCKCATGDLHGPYWYRFWREGGRLRKAYIRLVHVEEVRAACALYHQDRRLMHTLLATHQTTWRDLTRLVRELSIPL